MFKKLFIGFLVVAPVMTLGATQNISGVVTTLIEIANLLYKLVFVLVVLGFAYGVLKFVFQSGEEQEKGKGMMLWSIIALFVLVSIWGIVKILQGTLGIKNGETIEAPKIPSVTMSDTVTLEA